MGPRDYKGSYEKKAWLTSSKNPLKFKDEAKKVVSSFLKKTLSNYFEVDSPDDQAYSKQEASNKAKRKGKTKIHRIRCCRIIMYK
jgi:hypothetical protein